MARWKPGARERIVLAAVDLFTEQGYDATTVAQIAERAGITKSTFFRYFPDKRELVTLLRRKPCGFDDADLYCLTRATVQRSSLR